MHERLSTLVVAFLMAGACSGGSADKVAEPTRSEFEAKATTVVRNIFNGNYSAVRAEFDENLTSNLSETQLAGGRADFEKQFGSFESMGEPEALKRGDNTVINIPLVMSKGEGQARVTFDKNGKISGLFLLRSGVPVP